MPCFHPTGAEDRKLVNYYGFKAWIKPGIQAFNSMLRIGMVGINTP